MELTELYKRFRASLFQYISGKIASPEDAEDVLQDIFARIASRGMELPPKENVKNWLFIVSRNAVYDYYRKKGARQHLRRGNAPAAIEQLLQEEAYQDTTKGLDQCLQDFIDSLPEPYRQIVQDADLNGISQKKLAAQYSMPYSSLRSRVQRGRQQLKKMLMECCRIELDQRGQVLEVEARNSCAASSCKPCLD